MSKAANLTKSEHVDDEDFNDNDDVELLTESTSDSRRQQTGASAQQLQQSTSPFLSISFLSVSCVLVVFFLLIGFFTKGIHALSPSSSPSSLTNNTDSSSGTSGTGSTSRYIYEDVGKVTASPADERRFEWIRLPGTGSGGSSEGTRGLEILLVSDPATTKAAAAMDVHVGSLHDPYSGLAHFLEHALFLGTEKYPSENEYSSFLNMHGGSSNAYTDQEHTNYYFEVDEKSLLGALDRFSQFFIRPLFNVSSLSREVMAVDSEHRKNINSDGWRGFQLLKEAASPSSPFNSFSTGSKETLPVNSKSSGSSSGAATIPTTPEQDEVVKESMLVFHGTHYIASYMKAALIGKESLSVLREIAIAAFSPTRAVQETPLQGAEAVKWEIPTTTTFESLQRAKQLVDSAAIRGESIRTSTAVDTVFPPQPRGKYLDRLITYKPIEQGHSLSLLWPLWSVSSDPQLSRVPGVSFLVSLLGDEGEGSLLVFLRGRGLAEGVSAGLELDSAGFSVLQVSITLSPLAIANITSSSSSSSSSSNDEQQNVAFGLLSLVDAVTEAVYTYIDMLDEHLTTSTSFGAHTLVTTGVFKSIEESGFTEGELSLPTAILQRRRKSGGSTSKIQADGSSSSNYHNGVLQCPPKGPPPLTKTNNAPQQQQQQEKVTSLLNWPVDESTDQTYRVWREQLALAEIQFRYPQRSGDTASLASSLSRAMHSTTPDLILGSPASAVWQPGHALRILRSLCPSRALLFLTSSLLPLASTNTADGITSSNSSSTSSAKKEEEEIMTTNSRNISSLPHLFKEPIYDFLYGSFPMDDIRAMLAQEQQQELQHQQLPFASTEDLIKMFTLPARNPYIPTDFTLATHTNTINSSQDEKSSSGNIHNSNNNNNINKIEADLHIPSVPPSRSGNPEKQETSSQIWDQVKVHPYLLENVVDIDTIFATKVSKLLQNHVVGNSSSSSATAISSSLSTPPNLLSFWQPDTYFGWPRTSITLELLSRHTRSSPRASLLTGLLLGAISESVSEENYQVAKSGSSAYVTGSSFGLGFTVSVSGYSHSVQHVIENFLPKLLSFPSLLPPQGVESTDATARSRSSSSRHSGFQASRVSAQLLLRVEEIMNSAFDQPYQRAGSYINRMLGNTQWSEQALLQAAHELAGTPAPNVDTNTSSSSGSGSGSGAPSTFHVTDAEELVAKVLQHAHVVFSSIESIQILVSGNENISSTQRLVVLLMDEIIDVIVKSRFTVSSLSLSAATEATTTSFFLTPRIAPFGSHTHQHAASNPEDGNSAIFLVYQLGLRDNCEITAKSSSPSTSSSLSPPRWVPSGAETINTGNTDISDIDSWSCERKAAAFSILSSIAREPVFDELRTRQSLGYIVTAVPKVNLVSSYADVGVASALVSATTSTTATASSVCHGDSSKGSDGATNANRIRCKEVQSVSLASSSLSSTTPNIVINLTTSTTPSKTSLLPMIGDAMLSLAILVQGVAQPAHIQDELASAFMNLGFTKYIHEDMSAEEFHTAVNALRTQMTRAPDSPEEIHGWAWGEIAPRTYNFNRDEENDIALSQSTLADMRALEKFMVVDHPRRVGVEVFGGVIDMVRPSGYASAEMVDLVE